MAFALFVMVTEPGGRALSVLAFFVFVAAAGSLIYNMRQGPPSDSDEDDGAVDPGLKRFGQFKDFAAHQLDPAKHRKIAMFCTGGIRCEKASAYLLSRGFTEVYHLKGGILKYIEGVAETESRWRGECFVFDERVALGHGLRERGSLERQAQAETDE